MHKTGKYVSPDPIDETTVPVIGVSRTDVSGTDVVAESKRPDPRRRTVARKTSDPDERRAAVARKTFVDGARPLTTQVCSAPRVVRTRSQTRSQTPHVGLPNYGNTCYCNAALQALVPVGHLFQNSFMEPFFVAYAQKRRPDPNVARRGVRNPTFMTRRQQDSHEFLLELLDKAENERLRDHFYGKLEVSVVRPCGHSSAHEEPLCGIMLDASTQDFVQAVEHAFRDEEIQSSCDECDFSGSAIKRTRVVAWPKVLLAYWKRFGQQQHRKFPTDLVFRPTATETYDMVSVVNHQGATPRSGHYVACSLLRMNPSSPPVWGLCNDSVCSALEERHVQKAAEKAYYSLWVLRS